MSEPTSGLFLTPQELCSTVDALRSAIGKRLYWAITPEHPFRKFDWADVQIIVDTMAQAYAKALMLAREVPEVAPAFLDSFTLSDAAWELIDLVGTVEGWNEIFTHQHRTCPLCTEFEHLL